MKRAALYGYFVVVASILGFILFRGFADPKQLTAYVASADRRIYVVDIESGLKLATSDPIEGLGMPTAVEIDESGSVLYVASDRGFRQNDYFPLVAVNANDSFAVVGTFTLKPARHMIDNSVLNPDADAVYRVVKSRTKDHLYLFRAAPGHGAATEFDTTTGTIAREVDAPVTTPNSILSPDGTLLAEIWPSGSRTVDGQTTQWPGGVAVREIATGKMVSKVNLVNDQGLQPPWKKLATPFVHLARPQNILNVYDRDSGRRMASLNLADLTGLLPTGAEPVLVDGSTRVVLTMLKSEEPAARSEFRGFVVVVDYATGEIVRTTEIGPEPTNVVLTSGSNP